MEALACLLGLALGALILWGILNWDINRRFKKDIAKDWEIYNRGVEMNKIIKNLENMMKTEEQNDRKAT